MVMIAITLWKGDWSVDSIVLLVLSQIGLALIFGTAIAFAARKCMRYFNLREGGYDMIFLLGVACAAYAVPTQFDGNGYLSTYLCGLILGNSRLRGKKFLVSYFDGLSNFMQIVTFFLLGLLLTPSEFQLISDEGIQIAIFLTVIARPLVVAVLLLPFRMPLVQQAVIAFAGLRGASSIVFAIFTVTQTEVGHCIFRATFFIVLLSILFQGTLLPLFCRKLRMLDDKEDVMKTFNDYSEEVPVRFIRSTIAEKHAWAGKKLKEISLPPGTLVAMIERAGKNIIPHGDTQLAAGDVLVLSAIASENMQGIVLTEIRATHQNGLPGRLISELALENDLVILIKRRGTVVIPGGNVQIQEGDALVINHVS